MKGGVDAPLIEACASQLSQGPGGVAAAHELRQLVTTNADPLTLVAAIQALADRFRSDSARAAPPDLLTWDRSVGPVVAGIFLDEVRGRVSEIEHGLLILEAHQDDRKAIENTFRALHNLKGEAAALEVSSLRELAHRAEDLLATARTAGFLPARHGQALLRAVDGLRAVIDLLAQDAAHGDGQPIPLPYSWRQGLACVQDPDNALLEVSAPVTPASTDSLPVSPAAGPRASESLPLPGVAPDADSLLSWLQLQAVLSTVRSGGPSAHEAGNQHHEPEGSEAVRVPLVRLDRVLALIDELRRLHPLLSSAVPIDRARTIGRQATLLDRLQQESLELRLVPLADIFQRLQRICRDTARQLGKEVELAADHGDVELEKAVVDRLASPLMHLVRNAIDHGLETDDVRAAVGKTRQGTITISSQTYGNHVEIAVSDDGRGLDRDQILARARARGLWHEGQPETDEHIHPLIFLPGFSTAQTVSEISGRGVGLDVVRTAIQELGGAIRIASTPGKGTCFTLDVPMSMVLRDALVVTCAGRRVVVFQGQVQETLLIGQVSVRRALGDGQMLSWRGTLLPLIDLHPLFEPGSSSRSASALVITSMGTPFALGVDEVVGSQRLLVRPLGEAFRQNRAALGGCLLDDGSLALVIDPVGAMRMALAQRHAEHTTATHQSP